jgi:ribosomal-protein-alanine N-acetyltransferase
MNFLLARRYWGQGYLSEAIRVLLDYAFTELNLNRLEAEVHTDNTVSVRVLERLGFRREDRMRERWIVAGEKVDTATHGLLRNDWVTRSPP